MNRFDYVKYDEMAILQQGIFKDKFIDLEENITKLYSGRAGELAITKLEEAYMWIGKQIRDDQIARNKHYELQEERKNS